MMMMDMRYMWSEMDSPFLMLKRFQPSRLVIFRRSRRWKKGTGEAGFEGTGVGRVDRTVGGFVSIHERNSSRNCRVGQRARHLNLGTMAQRRRRRLGWFFEDAGRLEVGGCSPLMVFLGRLNSAKSLRLPLDFSCA